MADDSMFDKMVEMGMGMAMVNQIPRMMGSVITPQECTQTPPQISKVSTQFYVSIDNCQVGPLSEQELISIIQKGKINKETLVWKSGWANWALASQVPEINKLLLLYSK